MCVSDKIQRSPILSFSLSLSLLIYERFMVLPSLLSELMQDQKFRYCLTNTKRMKPTFTDTTL